MDSLFLKNGLENYFFIGFDIKTISSNVVISPSGSNDSGFEIVFENRNDIRLIIKEEPQKYAGNLLDLLKNSSTQKRMNCCSVCNDADIYINGIKLSKEEFVNYSGIWKSFLITTEIIPFNPDDMKIVLKKTINLVSMMLSLINYSIEGFEEGTKHEKISHTYERNPINRQICLAHKGYKCVICGFDFEKAYGNVGKEVIEVHHTTPVSEMEANHVVDPIKELEPVCSNCHTIIHKKEIPYTIDEVKQMIKEAKICQDQKAEEN